MRRNIFNRRIRAAALLLVVSTLLCACGSDSLGYTEEQEDVIANYAAQVVLKHDKKYMYSYLPDIKDDMKETQSTVDSSEQIIEPETEQYTTDSSESNHTEQQGGYSDTETVALNQVFGVEGLDIQYAGYDVVSTYPTDDSEEVFVIKAVSDSSLLVVKFAVINNTSQDITVNFMENGKRYKGIVNEMKKYNAQLTLLLDALNTYEGTIPAGTGTQLVLIFQTQLGSTADLSKLSVAVSDDSGAERVVSLVD